MKHLLIGILGLLLVTGCAVSEGKKVLQANPSDHQARVKFRHDLSASLFRHHVQVTQVGEQVRLLLGTDNLFYPHSSHFKPQSFRVLNQVAALLKTYDKEGISLMAYTDERCSLPESRALAVIRAEQVANYLWKHGTDARLMHIAGHATCSPPGQNTYTDSFARRIEISLQAFNV